METILDKIIANKRLEVEREKKETTIADFCKKIGERTQYNSFKEHIANSRTGIIAEFKRRSPSRGWIFENAKVQEVVPMYAQGGAAAISVLTDYDFFGGTLTDLQTASNLTATPLLRKDFMIDEYQLYQAAAFGADAILLIAAAMDAATLKQMAMKAKELKLGVLLEIHCEAELEHINTYVDAVGVNNRDLHRFVTNINNSFSLVEKIPNEFLKISESGISSVDTVRELRQAGFDGFLMGENFMKTENPGIALTEFIRVLEEGL